MQFGLAFRAIEMTQKSMPGYDVGHFGFAPRCSRRQWDVTVVAAI
jgi:NADH:ubiquinone oxidoreductase subunit B-like Fe-S oxidoreductase